MRSRRFPFVFTAMVALTLGTAVTQAAPAADAPQTLTITDFLQIPTLGSVAVAPDGRRVAYVKTWRDLEADTYQHELWLAQVASGAKRQITFQDSEIGHLAWRPDGALSFLRNVDDKAQVWVNLLDGSEPHPVTDFPEGVDNYWWSPSGTWLAVVANAVEDTTGPKKDDRADWTVFDRLEQPDTFPQLWLVPAGLADQPHDDREARQLSRPPYHVYHAAWSPDGAQLAVTYNPRFSSLVDEEQHVALVDVQTNEWRDISDPQRHASYAVWSPDGKQVAYFTDREQDLRAYLNLKDLVVYDLASSEETTLTPHHQLALGGTGSTPESAPLWSEDGRTITVSAAQGTAYDLYAVDVRARKLAPITRLAGNLGSWDLRRDTLAYVESARHLPGSLSVRAAVGGEAREIDTTNDSVARFHLLPARKLALTGKDGQPIEGFLYLPPGAGDRDHLPGVIEMHGGPYFRYGNAWTTRYPWQVLSQAGFAVFIVNPRGGTGYGQDFLRGVYRNFGTDDYLDIMAAVDTLVARGTVDGDHLGFTGYSYGGLMTDVVISRTDRFKCAVSIAGIFDFVSAMGESNPQLFIDSYAQPWSHDLQRMWEHSPVSRAASFVTPTLVMHGLADEPVDPRQSIEMFSYLQLNGVPSRLVLYPDEGHGINRPSHMLDYETRELQWFQHYLLGDENAAGAKPPVPVEPEPGR